MLQKVQIRGNALHSKAQGINASLVSVPTWLNLRNTLLADRAADRNQYIQCVCTTEGGEEVSNVRC